MERADQTLGVVFNTQAKTRAATCQCPCLFRHLVKPHPTWLPRHHPHSPPPLTCPCKCCGIWKAGPNTLPFLLNDIVACVVSSKHPMTSPLVYSSPYESNCRAWLFLPVPPYLHTHKQQSADFRHTAKTHYTHINSFMSQHVSASSYNAPQWHVLVA